MKKLLSIASILLCSIHLTQASESVPSIQEPAEFNELETIEQESIDDIAKDVGVIRFTITFFKDRSNHDEAEWQTIITKAVQSMYRLQTEQSDSSTMLNELNEIMLSLQNAQHENGIAGEFTVEASNGEPTKNCCGDNCTCLQVYRGNCPCSLNNARANRCLFPEENPFDDQYEEEETSSDTDAESEVSFEDVDLDSDEKKKRTYCCK